MFTFLPGPFLVQFSGPFYLSSDNIIKHQAIDILLNPKQDTEGKIQKLAILFKTAAIPIRKNRTPPRKKTSYARSYNFQLRKKKHVY